MDYEKAEGRLRVRLIRDFNLLAARRIESLAGDVDAVHIDLAAVKIVDSVALRLLYQLIRSGKRVTLSSPPDIMREAIAVLGLESVLDIDAMTTEGGVAP